MNPSKRSGPKTTAEKNRDRLSKVREVQVDRKEQELNDLDGDAILAELKKKGLPTFGTNKERLDRLKKHLGVPITDSQPKKSNVVGNIEAIQRKRDERRRKMEDERFAKEERKAENEAAGRLVDVEFESMIAEYRHQVAVPKPFTPADNLKICVIVRKRPIFKKEEVGGEIDAISCANPHVIVHEPKMRVDGITKFLENHQFTFDNSFGDADETTDVYANSLRPLCPFILSQGTVTCFAYGQTGSGKTFTMKGLQSMVVQDLFRMVSRSAVFYVSFYEIYGGKCFDLLNSHEKLRIMEDRNGNIQVFGLVEKPADSVKEVHALIEYGNAARTTHSTTSNSDSSRSHAICQLVIRDGGRTVGQLRLVDLAVIEM
jgi:kinesin family protein 2/24